MAHSTKQQCRACAQPFEIFPEDTQLYLTQNFPPPTLCPDCRHQRRMAWRNERKLYQRNCDLCKKAIVSSYTPTSKHVVYCPTCWWSDSWDATSEARSFDFSRPFIEQYAQLLAAIPREGLVMLNCENCEFNNMIRDSKDCYMCSLVADRCEQIFYSYWIVTNSFRLVDCAYSAQSQLSYECLHITNCFNCTFLVDCINSNNSFFSYDLIGCGNCILCSGLRNKEYCIENKQVSKNEFEKVKSEILQDHTTFEKYKNRFLEKNRRWPRRADNNIQVESCLGQNLKQCKNCFQCFDGINGEDLRYLVSFGNAKDCVDCYAVGFYPSELCYESLIVKGDQNIYFSNNITHGNTVYYSDSCINCRDIVGCVGLKYANQCILNKAYSQKEFETLWNRLKSHMHETGEWGRFFPASLSPFGYNETVAMEEFPITRQEALDLGFPWCDYEAPPVKAAKLLKSNELPERIQDVTDSILETAIECEITQRPFRIIAKELEFYREQNLPLPRKHPEIRHASRLSLRPERKLVERGCSACEKPITTVHNSGEVLCEGCYVEAVTR